MLNTIDLSSYLSGASSPEQDRAVAQAFVDAASQVGFAYVTGWESVVPAELVQEVFEYVSWANGRLSSFRGDSRFEVNNGERERG
jgi:isopenicillin N synthase-like dioxygenase